jgi:outer membrane protein OmpA-like peptidoglycan-associated protein
MRSFFHIYNLMTIGKFVFSVACALLCTVAVDAQTVSERNASATLRDNNVDVNVDLELDKGVKSNNAVVLTPILQKGSDAVTFPSVVVYGHNRYYYYQRKNGDAMLTGEGETTLKAKELPTTINYHATTPYQPWMEGSDLIIRKQVYGCCNEVVSSEDNTLASNNEFVKVLPPLESLLDLVYVTPEPEAVKSRAVSGDAYIIFPVNKTTIDEGVANNRAELRKITSTLDSVRNDKYVTVNSLNIKGYASPEGKYSLNEKLAKGRTEAVKNYVAKYYNFDASKIRTDYVAENWDGLREYVENSSISNRDGILEIIDGDLDPDPKEWKLKSTYKNEYKTLLADCYPGLRKTEYKIDYVIAKIEDVNEIKTLVKTHPQELSLNEFYQAAQTYEPGSEDFNQVFEVAVHNYPNDPVANLNAANASLSEGNLSAARRYLAKAGDSAQAEYSRGYLSACEKDYASAKEHFTKALNGGVKEAEYALEKLEDYYSTN